ncbi:MAG: ATP synthase F1 subunit delta [Deltaproteobacteria bacterium]|nr:MAG: ATP synthase F1 subunit delta [Deltaproteobacteria bacterium]
MSAKAARRFARALFDLMEKDHRRAADELERFSGLLSGSPELREVLTSPAFTQQERKRVVDLLVAKLGWKAPLDRFLWVVVSHRSVKLWPEISAAFTALVDEHEGKLRARVESARPLDAEELSRLTANLATALGKQVIVEHRPNPELIGGVRVRVGDLLIDGSLRTMLERLRQRLIELKV